MDDYMLSVAFGLSLGGAREDQDSLIRHRFSAFAIKNKQRNRLRIGNSVGNTRG